MKNIQRNVIFTGIGYVLPLLASLLTIPLMLRHFGTDVYGLYIICISLIGFMNFIDLGVGQAIVKYVAEYEVTGERDKVKPVLDIGLLSYIVLGLLTVGLLYGFAPALSAFIYDNNLQNREMAQAALRITSLALLLSYVNQFFLNVCRAYHRFDIPALIHNSANIGGIVLASILLVMGYSLREVLWGYVLVQSIALICGFWFSRQVLPEGLRFGLSFDAGIFAAMISFSVYTFIGNSVIALTSRADKLLIGGVIGTEAVTYYQIPFTIAQMLNGIVNTLVHIMFPRFSELASLGSGQELLRLYKNATHVVFFISAFIAVMLVTTGESFLSLWISPEFAAKTVITLQLIAVFSFFNSNLVVAYWAAQGAGEAKLTALVIVLSAVAYGFGIFYLGERYSYNGVAVALYLGLLPFPLLFMWVSRHIGHRIHQYLLGLLLTFVLGTLAVYLLAYMNSHITSRLMHIFANGAVAAVVMVVFLGWFFARLRERRSAE